MKRLTFLFTLLVIAIIASAQAKYVFYFIGDGMGANQVLGAEMYLSAIKGEPLGRVQTLMTTFPYSGHASSYSASNGITDSAAAGTCLATGSKTTNGTLGLNEKGDEVRTIAEELKAAGWGIGIMTTVAIDHATPAAFYAHVPERNQYYIIGQQLAESQFDFFGGAGFHHPQGKKDNEKINLYRLAEEKGYAVAHGYEEAQALVDRAKGVDRLIMVQKDDDQGAKHGDNLPYAIDRKEGDLTLAQIVSTAIPFLEQRHERFFMMVEGGMVDYACHGDDAATAFGEVWDMNEAMQVAYKFYLAHPDETLIVVTADHETGGLALGNSDYTLHLEQLQNQKCSSWILSDLFTQLFKENKKPSWAQVQQIYREQLGFWESVEISKEEEKELIQLYKDACNKKGKDTKTMYKTINSLGEAGIALLNKKAHIGWTTRAHSAHAVPIFSIGVGAERFSGWHDNTEIVPLIRKAVK
ncbi:MAG: alkaline phosphatase [Paludibacteraceae bacterium]|nr:alkaline phosphatase [Paludibacteraceae bacterium]